MEGSWGGVLAVLVILAGLTAPGSSYEIIEGPQNVTVLNGSEARFNCTVTHGWKLIMWSLKGVVELSITSQQPIITNDRFTSVSYNRSDRFISEMIIHDVQPGDSGLVQCSLQNSNVLGSAFLTVQVMGTLDIPSNSLVVTQGEPCNVTCYALGWTPLPDISWELEVPVSNSSYYSVPEPGDLMSALSILALTPLGNGTLTCVAELKNLQVSKSLTVNLTVVQPLPESSYQNEIRKTANTKPNKTDPETRFKSGKENLGYSSDEARAAQIASLPPKSGEVSLQGQRSHIAPYQAHKTRQPSAANHPRVSFDTASPQKVRNATLV
ncbi:immunoglobulin superfamily member 5 isoform X2 [Phodopus roborovskii]|uniref:immunoglobulin superfamily member 5 isoform X2 n=1 Tax=Phodopus roborovskii TaxID=109678 RepID=UPI0021E40F5D|nr:immunoglobulin superfamily member 5 isoform X2 [Phodopus roborovskii]